MFHQSCKRWLAGGVCTFLAASAWAAPPANTAGLRAAFEAAWARQPEAQSAPVRAELAEARREAAARWSVEPPAVSLAAKSDRYHANDGSREYEIGVAVPLWLPGERSGSMAVADAEAQADRSREQAARLRTAAEVREAYWNWQLARIEAELAAQRHAHARQLTDDVLRRVRAGELARADGHQAEGALAGAVAAAADAGQRLAAAAQQLRLLTGQPPVAAGDPLAALEQAPPATPADASGSVAHPVLAEAADRAEVARRAATLAAAQRGNNPELSVATTRERGNFNESYAQTVTVGLRIPFGGGAQHQARRAAAQVEAIETARLAELARERLQGELDIARLRVASAHDQSSAADTRARLAAETRGFYERAFRLGEADLPTRLRIELEASDADRDAARARIELAAAVSALRQAAGLLPE